MRTIKSFWTKPKACFYEGLEEIASWSILSTLTHIGECEIFTDTLGAEWLKALKLPIPNTSISLELNNAPGDGFTWNEAKIYCNAIQYKPFLQTDLDVIVGRDWAGRIKSASVVAERHYSFPHQWANGLVMPKHWQSAIDSEDGRAVACGTFGGNDIAATRKIALAGLEFIEGNRMALKQFRPVLGALIAEEWAILREYDWNEISTIVPDSLQLAANFCAPEKSYMHRQGVIKRTPEGIANTRARLEKIRPGQSRRCEDVRKEFAKAKA